MKTKSFYSLAVTAISASALFVSPALANHQYQYQNYPAQYQVNDYDRNEGYGDRDRDDQRYEGGYRCKKGNTGLIVGAVAGGLLGRAIAGRYRGRTTGTIIGAGAGALAGRAIERSGGRGC